MAASASFVPIRELLDSWSEPALSPAEGDGVLDRIGIDDFAITEKSFGPQIDLTLEFKDELGFEIPGLDGFGLYLGSKGSTSTLSLQADLGPVPAFRLVNVSVVIRLPSGLFNPVTQSGNQWKPKTLADGTIAPFEITVGGVDVQVSNGRFDLIMPQGGPALTLSPVMIGDTGVVIESKSIQLHFDRNATPPPGQSKGFQGIYIPEASIHMPGEVGVSSAGVLKFKDCAIGAGGFTGSVSYTDNTLTWNATQKQYTGTLAGSFFGFTGGLKNVELGFTQNALTAGSLVGEMFVPYLERRIGVALGLSLSGDIAVALAAPQATNPDPAVKLQDGLLHLHEKGVIDATLDSLAFEKRADDVSIRLGGKIRPLFAGVEWPEVGVKALTVHADGRVEIGGGWLDLPQQKATDFYGFPLEIRKVGFGSENGKRWVGFSGGLKLVDGLPVGGSVEGLRVLWDPTNPADFSIDLKGIELELKIPDVLWLKGRVAFFQEQGKEWFQGGVKVELYALNCTLDAQVLVGRTPSYTFFYIFLEAGLPAGIPLFQTGLGIYGLGGLFGYNVRPDRRDGEAWYEGWYKRSPEGPTDAAKWTDQEHRRVFGATLTIGTLPDNGTSVHARVLVILIVPGPLVLMEGKANLIRDRKSIKTVEPLFKSLAVIDGEAGTFLLNVEPHVVSPHEPPPLRASAIDLTGVAEGFFDFNNPDRWYLNVGVKEPRERRVRALILRLFQANAYFMLNQQRLALGAYVGIDERYTYGPATLRYGVWFEADAVLAFRPLQLTADAGLHGRAELKAFGVGIGVELDAVAHVSTPKPFEFTAELRAKADLPWPLPDLEVRIPYEIRNPQPPALTVPLQSVDVITLKGSEFWDTGIETAPPLVPLDGKPALVFAKSMTDVSGIGGNVQSANGAERAGELTFSYRLESIQLEKRVGNTWTVQAGSPDATGPTGSKELRGMWVPMSAQGDAPPSSKLVLRVRSPFSGIQGVQSGSAAEEFADRYPGYPGVYAVSDYEALAVGTVITGTATAPYAYEGLEYDPGGLATWHGGVRVVDAAATAIAGWVASWPQRHALFIPQRWGLVTVPSDSGGGGAAGGGGKPTPPKRLRIGFPQTHIAQVRLDLTTLESVTVTAYDVGGMQLDRAEVSTGAYTTFSTPQRTQLTVNGPGIRRVDIDGGNTYLFAVRFLVVGGTTQDGSTNASNKQTSEQQWSEEDELLDPDTTYRLRVKTSVDVTPESATTMLPEELDAGPLVPAALPAPAPTGNAQRYTFAQDVYFRTKGPPGFVGQDIDRHVAAQAPTLPDGAGTPKAPKSLARSLTTYVARTTPGEGGDLVYRAYDVLVHFNEPYVERFYAGYGNRSLTLALADRNGDPPRERTGGSASAPQWTTATPTSEWIKERDPALTRAEEQWVNLLQDTQWLALSPEDAPRHDILRVSLTGPALRPRMTYLATLRAHPDNGAIDGELFRFSFTTSRFASFVHQIHSFSGRVWDSEQGRETPLAALTSAQLTTLDTASERGAPEDFDTLAQIFAHGDRALPESLEVTVVRDAVKRWGFLIESPEPIDGARTRVKMSRTAQPVVSAVHRDPVRLRDARFGTRTGTDYASEWIDLLVTETVDLDGYQLQHLKASGTPDDYDTIHTFAGTTLAHAGMIIRVHAGLEPTPVPTDPGVLHVYAATALTTAGWLLHPAGDTLRLLGKGGMQTSVQGFLPQWGDEDARWVWNADRTRALVFPEIKSPGCFTFFVAALPAWLQQLLQSAAQQPQLGASTGTYRLTWEYALDTPGQALLSKGGHSTSEEAVLQVNVI